MSHGRPLRAGMLAVIRAGCGARHTPSVKIGFAYIPTGPTSITLKELGGPALMRLRKGRRCPGRGSSSADRVADGGVTEIGDLHPVDRELALAGENYAALYTGKTVNHQPTKHLCAKAVHQHECLSASCWAASEQLKGAAAFTDCRDGRHGICSLGGGGLQPKLGVVGWTGCRDRGPSTSYQSQLKGTLQRCVKV
jgi:hypothetical protein